MKKFIVYYFVAFALLQFSCRKVDCGSHGINKGGDCNCENGWIKDNDGKCNIKDCGANAIFVSNTQGCACLPGWEKDTSGSCSIQMRQKFIGTWRGTHASQLGPTSPTYDIVIEEGSSDITKVKCKNFFNFSCSGVPFEVYGELDNTGVTINSFTSLCPDYIFPATKEAYLIDPTTLKIETFIVSSSVSESYTGVYHKQ